MPLEQVQDAIAIFLKMMKAFDHSHCPKNCSLPRYHTDLLKMEGQKTFMDSEVKYRNIGKLRQTRIHFVDGQLSVADGIAMVNKR